MPDDETRQPDGAPSGGDAAPESVTPEALSGDVEDLFAAGARSTAISLSAPESAAPAPEDGGDAEAGDGEESGEEDSPPESADDETDGEEEDPNAVLIERTRMVLQAPQRINEVPGRLRGAVIQEAIAAAYQRGLADQTAEVATTLASEEQLRSFVQEHEEQRRTDPDGFATWADANPQDAARFYEGKAHFAQRAASATPPAPSSPEGIQARADAKLARVAQLPPAARQQFEQRVTSGEFKLTEEGLAALEQALLDAAFEAAKNPQPAPRTPTAREAAAAQRAAAPRPLGVDRGGGAPNKELGWDVDELLAAPRAR